MIIKKALGRISAPQGRVRLPRLIPKSIPNRMADLNTSFKIVCDYICTDADAKTVRGSMGP